MPGICLNSIGIMPAGALGVAFYHHLTGGNLDRDDVIFLDRPAGGDSTALRRSDSLHIKYDGKSFTIPTQDRFLGGIIECYDEAKLPELIMVATNPDQIDSVLQGILLLLEWMRDEGTLESKPLEFPYFLFVANGIYFNRTRYRYVELLERAFMEGRLPDLWPDIAPQLVCRLMRGPTMVLGHRTGQGAGAVYHPGYKGPTLISGGDVTSRQRVRTLLADRGLPVEIADQSPVSIELRKALMNLIGNLFGVIYSVGDEGWFRSRSLGEIVVPEHYSEFVELGEHVYSIARAIRAVPDDAYFTDIWPKIRDQIKSLASHYPSTVQSIAQLIADGTVLPEMTPNEAWLLNPLKELAADLQLREAYAYLLRLEERYRAALLSLRGT
ncbi:MAG: hypothetical protein M0Q01_09715 [Syntrophales bacterium]|nr:hypothetical protein [Syntrophales bacterium]